MLTDVAVEKYLPLNFFDNEVVGNVIEYSNAELKIPKRNKMESLILTGFNRIQNASLEILEENRS